MAMISLMVSDYQRLWTAENRFTSVLSLFNFRQSEAYQEASLREKKCSTLIVTTD